MPDPGPIRSAAALAIVCGAALLGIGLAACTDDGTDVGDAQPTPGGSVFVTGGFDELPRYRGSTPAGPRAETGDVVSRSYTVQGTTPALVLDFYREELTGWTSLGPEQVGEALREEFLAEDGTRLEVSSVVLQRGGTDMTQTVQYSLVLHQS